MRRIVVWLASTVTVVVLLFGYHTSTNKPASAAASSSSTQLAAARLRAPRPAPPARVRRRRRAARNSASSGTKTYTGSVAQTRWGPVQVQVTVSGGTLTGVKVLQQPTGNPRDTQINDYALPILVQDTLDAQSANIDMVSGATVTSDGYVQSLQSALDQAGR